MNENENVSVETQEVAEPVTSEEKVEVAEQPIEQEVQEEVVEKPKFSEQDTAFANMRRELDKYKELFKLVLIVLENYTKSASDVQSGGLVKLLNSPEYSDVEKAKDILNVLSDKTKLKDIFDTKSEEGVEVKLGDELDNEKLNDCAVITTPLVIDGKKIASIGVIGPERIDYASIASALKIIADEINERRSNKDKGGG